MIRTLRLENYRSFERYELRDLARVNLLVGPNNCGKTSVLEAVQLLVSRGDPRVLTQLASRRGESAAGIGDETGTGSLDIPSITNSTATRSTAEPTSASPPMTVLDRFEWTLWKLRMVRSKIFSR